MSTKSSTVEIGGRSYISTDELAQRLGVSAKTIWRWQKQGFLPAFVKIGRVRLYREDRMVGDLREQLIKEKPAEFQSRRAFKGDQ
jgi:excisionase family DNA binding protein